MRLSLAIFLLVLLASTGLFVYTSVLSFNHIGTLTIDDEALAGKKIWHTKGCIECHTIFGHGNYLAPDLTKIYGSRSQAWFLEFFQDPPPLKPGAKRTHITLTQEETLKLLQFFACLETIDTGQWPPEPFIKNP